MRRWLSLVLIAAIAIAACTPVDPAEHEWCHIYWLDEPMMGLFIDHGGQDGGGIYGEWQPELSNYLYQFEIIEPFMVYPDALEVIVSRSSSVANIAINEVEGTAFGHDISLLSGYVMGSGQAYATLTMPIDFDEESPVGDDRITVSFTTFPGELYVEGIAVYGRGVSPYGYTECGDMAATNTPVDIPTQTATLPTPTNTPVPSITNTPTITPTATATVFSNCSVEYDFTVHDGGFEAYRYPGGNHPTNTHGAWLAGVGWQGTFANTSSSGNSYMGALSIRLPNFPQDMTVTNIEYTYTKTAGNQAPTFVVEQIYAPNFISHRNVRSNTLTSGTHNFSLSYPLDTADDFWFIHGYHSDQTSPYTASGSFNLTELIITGHCIVPSPTPTSTFTPSNTPTSTGTNTPLPGTPATATPTLSRTPVPTATRTLTPTNLPPVQSPTQRTPTITPTFEPSLPAPTAVPTRTLLPPSTAIGTVTAESTFPVPGFGTGAPNITAVSTAPAVGTLSPIDGHSHIYDLLSTAVVEVNDLPGDMTGYVPDPDITPMLAYAKWFLSCTSLNEILGENVGTMACHATVGISLIVILSAVYTSLRIITLVMKFAVWIFMKIRDLIPLI